MGHFTPILLPIICFKVLTECMLCARLLLIVDSSSPQFYRWGDWGSESPHLASAGAQLPLCMLQVRALTTTVCCLLPTVMFCFCLLCPFHANPIYTLEILRGLFPFALSGLVPTHSWILLFLQAVMVPFVPTTFPSCCLNRSPYVLIIQVFGSQTHLGGRFSNNQSSSRAERWKMRGLGFKLGGRF